MLLWPWCRMPAIAPSGRLAWEPPYAAGAALKRQKKKKKKKLSSLTHPPTLDKGLLCTKHCTRHRNTDLKKDQKRFVR